jgi:thioredoxin reductase (NADPH)
MMKRNTLVKYDLIIIGAGPAGLTAGIYGVRNGLKTLILEEKLPGGQIADSPLIENYPGFPSINGQKLAEKLLGHSKRFNVKIHELERASKLNLKCELKIVNTEHATYTASAIIIATGCHQKKLKVPGESKFLGRGVSYCAVCDGFFFKNKKVLVAGGGNGAAVTALHLSELTSKVTVIHRRDSLRMDETLFKTLQKKGVQFLWNSRVTEILGKDFVKSIAIQNNKTGNLRLLDFDAIFIQIGESPNSEIAQKAGIRVNKEGHIVVDQRQRTNIQGVFAAGDITTCPVKQVGTAIGQGIIAACEAFGYIRRPYHYKGQ